MTRALPFLAGLVAAIVVLAGSGAQAAGSAQTLGIVLQRNAAATERLPFYRTSAPVAVAVRGDAARIASMTITARAPDGSAISAPLLRDENGFTVALHLAQPGTWTLALSTQLGSMRTALADVPLDVVDQDGAETAARCAYALSSLCIGAGLTLLVRARRRIPARVRV